jgi:hypothetical protein
MVCILRYSKIWPYVAVTELRLAANTNIERQDRVLNMHSVANAAAIHENRVQNLYVTPDPAPQLRALIGS